MKHLCVLCLLCALCGSASAAKADKSMNIVVNGETRQYWLYVPNNAKANCPLVVSLHGASGHSTDRSPFRTDVADREGCIVVYPQGNPIYFPVFGGTVNGWDASGEENGDVDFIRAIVEDVAKRYNVNRNRVYCCGFSNGGMMTYALTNTCSDLFAAYASISGFPLNEFHLRHVGKRPVPFLHIHGKGDGFVNYALMPTIVDEMVARMGANPVPVKTSVSGMYDKSVYEATDGSFPYVYYEINDMGHNDFTANTEDGNSSLTMWKFFRQYTLDDPCDTTLKWMPRIETEGFTPKDHGWTMNSGKTLLSFGLGAKTDANQNVYHSLQLRTGHYKLSFHADGTAGKTVTVKLAHLQPTKVVLDKTVEVGEDVTLYFDVENEDFGQYKIVFMRENTTENITISNIVLRTLTKDEVTGIKSVDPTQSVTSNVSACYDLNGRPVATRNPAKGVYVKNGRKEVMK